MKVCMVCGFRWEGEEEGKSMETCPECGSPLNAKGDNSHFELRIPTDLREFIEICESEGELKRIKAQVDWYLELGHVAKLNEEKSGPALLFENVRGYSTSVLTSAYTKPSRVAIALGMSRNSGIVDIAHEWMKRVTESPGLIKPKTVSDGPILENVMEDNAVDLAKFPVPQLYPEDGGRYFGTTAYLITRDPETGYVNLGVYRMQMLDNKSLGLQLLKGKDAEVMLNKYKELGKPMPAVAVIGGSPLGFLVGSTLVPYGTSEYEVIGALQGKAVEVIESDLTGLPIPANAEIAVEGFVDPEKFRAEGPFGEYTGYYSGKAQEEFPKPWLRIERIFYRNDPVFWTTTVGRPVTDTHIVQSINRTAELWTQLQRMGVPGIQSVYIPPESTGRFWVIVSIKQLYPGHGRHVGLAVFATVLGNYGVKGVIVVDEDIRADDLPRVWWALSVRYNPVEDTEIIKKGRSTPLDPSLPAYTDYYDHRHIVSRILIDATTPYEWKMKPTVIELDRKVIEGLKKRWNEFEFEWTPQ